MLEPLGVAIHAVRRAQIKESSRTLVFGAGVIGLLCAAMAQKSGSSNVAIVDVQPERVKFAVENGFAHEGYVVPSKQKEGTGENDTDGKLRLAKAFASLVTTIEGPGGYATREADVAFECTGVEVCTQTAIYVGPPTRFSVEELTFQATRPGGQIMIVGMGTPVQTIPISAAAFREVDILGTFRYANTYPDAIEMVSSGKPVLPDLSKLVTHRFHGLENAPQAFEMAAKAIDGSGNLVLKVVVETDVTQAGL